MAAGISAKANIDGAKKFQDDLKNMTAKSKALSAQMNEMATKFDKEGKSMGDNTKARKLANEQITAQKQKISLLEAELKRLQEAGEGESATAYKLREQIAKANTELINMQHSSDKAADAGKDNTASMLKTAAAAGAIAVAVKGAVSAIKSIAGAAANAAKAVWNLGVESGQWADALITQSAQTGVDTETLQEWSYAARFVDTEVSTMTKGMSKLTQAYAKGNKSKKKTVTLTKGVTVSMRKENGEIKTQAEFYLDTIDALHGMTNVAQRNAAAQKIFGKSYTDMLPLIESGTAALRQYGQEAHDMGVIITGENVSALGKFDDQMQRLDAQFSAVKTNIALAFLPIMETVAERMSGFMSVVTNAISDGLQEEDIDTIVDGFFAMFEPAMSDDGRQNMNAIEFIGKLISKLLEQLGVNKEKILSIGGTVLDYIWQGIKKGASDLWNNFWDSLTHYDVNESPLNKWFAEKMDNIMGNLLKGWNDWWQYDVLGGVDFAWGQLSETIGGWFGPAWQWGYDLFDNIGQGILGAWEFVKNGGLLTVGGNLLGTVGGWASEAWESGKSFIGQFVGGIFNDWTTDDSSTVDTVGTDLFTVIGGWITSSYEEGKQFLASFIGGIVSKWAEKIMTIGGIGDELSEKFTGWVEDAKTWGKDLIKNFCKGIKEKWKDLKEGVSSVGQAIKRRLGFSEPKEGPLSDFHTYAPDMIDLFVKGIKDNSYKIDNALNRTFGVLPSTDPTAVNGARTTNYGGVSINVYGAAGQDVNQLADIVMQRMQNAVNRREAVFA